MRSAASILTSAVLALATPARMDAQCSDGTPLPCRSAVRPDTNVVVVLPFAVSGQESALYLRNSMVDLLYIALDGVGRMRIEYAPSSLRRLDRVSDPTDLNSVAGVALELGAGRVISGTIVVLGNDLRVRADVFDAIRRRPLFSVERRASTDNVALVVDSLAADILARRLVPPRDRVRLSVGEYSSRSARALQAYLIARQHARRGERRVAADSLRSALRLDPDFGLAYLLMLRIESAQNNVTGMPADSIRRAARERVSRFPERLRALFEGGRGVQGNRLSAIAAARANVNRFPDDPDMAFFLADAYFHHGLNMGEPRERVVAAFERALAIDDQDPELLDHYEALMLEAGDSLRSRAAVDRCRAVAPQVCGGEIDYRALFRREDPHKLAVGRDSLHWGLPGNQLLRKASWDPAFGLALTDSFAQLQTGPSRWPALRSNAYVVRSNVALARGQHDLAWAYLDSAGAADGTPRHEFWLLHDIVSGTRATEVAAIPPLRPNQSGQFWIGDVVIRAWWSAARQPVDSAERFLRLLESGEWDDRPLATTIATGLRGLVANRRGDTARAIDLLEQARPGNRRTAGPLRAIFPGAVLALLHAQIEHARGNHALAKLYLADVYPINNYPTFIADAEETRASVALALGDSAAARTHLRNVTRVWEKADPTIQPRVTAARATLARLSR